MTEPPVDALAADYARAGFGQGLPWGTRPALVLVDMIRAYFEPGAAFYMGSDECLSAAARLLGTARQAAIPILFTRVEYDSDGISGGLFVRKIPALRRLVAGDPLGEIMPEVAPGDREIVVVKQYASAFFGTSLAATLRTLGVDTLIITGVSTSGCVRATAVDALQHGYRVLVPRDGVADRALDAHNGSLLDIDAKYGDVVSIDEAIAAVEAAVAQPSVDRS